MRNFGTTLLFSLVLFFPFVLLDFVVPFFSFLGNLPAYSFSTSGVTFTPRYNAFTTAKW